MENGKKGGKSPKRKAIQIQNDLVLITPLLLKGVDLRVIRDTVNSQREYQLTLSDIGKDIKKILNNWHDERVKMIDRQRALELAKIDRLEAVYWVAWEASQEAKIKKVSKQRGVMGLPAKGKESDTDPVELPGLKHVQTERHTISSVGDSRWTDGIQWCIDQRCQLLGLKQIEPEKPADFTIMPVRNITFETHNLKSHNAHIQEAIIVPDDQSIPKQIIK